MLQFARLVQRPACIRFTLLAALVVLLAGCQVLPLTAAGNPTETVAPSPTATALPSPTATLEPTATPAPTDTPVPTPTLAPLQASVDLDPAILMQGQTLAVHVTTNRPCAIEGALADAPLKFVSEDGLQHLALAGIDALAESGERAIHIAITGEDLQTATLDMQVNVVPGTFETETLTFSDEVSKLLDPAISQPEAERLAELWSQFTPHMVLTDTLSWPVEGAFTSYFGTRRQYGDQVSGYHAGLDIDGEEGDVVLAGGPGTVVLAEQLQVRGNAVILDHGAGVFSAYYHLSEIEVEVGQEVAQGEPIGKMGSTGLVTGSHLHWELHVGGVAVEPTEWVERSFVTAP
ncbi:MAG: M23 family metallopeptidase [Anaerolineae bacterium]